MHSQVAGAGMHYPPQ